MKEQLINFETAKLYKEKKFRESCSNTYENKVLIYLNTEDYPESHNDYYNEYSAPTQSLLQKWLREVHNIHFHIYHGNNRKWCIDIYDISPSIQEDYCAGLLNQPNEFINYKTYEEALEKGLQEALKLIK